MKNTPKGPRLRIVSGGQTGVDRAALDWAIANGIPHGGWCPKGRRAEDGPLPRRYKLRETSSAAYAQRTRWNVRDSDATLIFSATKSLTGGSELTRRTALRLGKPVLHLWPRQREPSVKLHEFIEAHGVRVLNVAGPRESEKHGLREFVWRVLNESGLESLSKTLS
jgi:hypothetical protein